MYAVTEPHVETLPAEPYAGNEVSCAFVQQGASTWVGTVKCKHGQAQSTTHLILPGNPPLDAAQMVFGAYRQHELLIGGDCPSMPPKLNATTLYAPSLAIPPGERRIIIEQSATIPAPARSNFSFYGRLTCLRAGAFQIEAKIQLAGSVAAGARGIGQVFIAGIPAMLTAPVLDVAGQATALPSGILNLFPGEPLAVAYTNTGTTNQDVQSTTLTVSEVWVP